MGTDLSLKLASKSCTVGVIGLGYVGLPLTKRFSESGMAVVGFDNDADKVASLLEGRSYIAHISDEAIHQMAAEGTRFTSELALATECDALIICVPTPLGKNLEPDLSFVTDTVDALLPYLRAEQLLSLESTTYPGTSEEKLLPRIQSAGFTVGEDFFFSLLA